MTAALQELESQAHAGPAGLDQFLRSHRFPLVEGRTVTFVYIGAADSVQLRHWLHGLPNALGFQRVQGTPVWRLTIDIPEGSRVEYKLEITRGGHRQLITDPLNDNYARDPYGANSVVKGQGYEDPEWARHDAES